MTDYNQVLSKFIHCAKLNKVDVKTATLPEIAALKTLSAVDKGDVLILCTNQKVLEHRMRVIEKIASNLFDTRATRPTIKTIQIRCPDNVAPGQVRVIWGYTLAEISTKERVHNRELRTLILDPSVY